jgi:phosphatidylcholine synthase
VPFRTAGAYLVHAYTGSGVLLAGAALAASLAGRPRDALLWLAVAVFVDATDGALARWADVRRFAPVIDGARLDDVVDYLTYVFVPVVVLWQAGALPAGWAWLPAGAVLLASACGFARQDAKTADHYFTGFPSYWNIVAVYALAWPWSPLVTGVVLLALAVLVFVPIRYIYPSRTTAWRSLTLTLTVVWGAQMSALIWWLDASPRWLVWSGVLYPAYYVGLSLYLQVSRPSRRPMPARSAP